MKALKIGVLALQGGVEEHMNMLKKCGVEAAEVRTPKDLEQVQGLIIPGGESTAIGRLIKRVSLDRAIKEKHRRGMPIFGTCAGLILLAKNISGSKQFRLGLADIVVKRNDYGRQVESFETNISLRFTGGSLGKKPFRAVFIRAPRFKPNSKDVTILAKHGDDAVLARQGNLLMASFHPELTEDARIHKYFIGMVNEWSGGRKHSKEVNKLKSGGNDKK